MESSRESRRDRESRHDYFERLIFSSLGNRRFTQSSPILPEVWLAYAHEPSAPQDLLLTPHRDAGPGRLAMAVRERLKKERARKKRSPVTDRRLREPGGEPAAARIAYNQFDVVVTLHFDELMRVVMPLSYWWQHGLADSIRGMGDPPLTRKQGLVELARLLSPLSEAQEQKQAGAKELLNSALDAGELYRPRKGGLDADIVWMCQAVGSMAFLTGGGEFGSLPKLDPAERAEKGPPDPTPWSRVTDALFELFQGVAARAADLTEPLLWNLHLNRRCSSSLYQSTVAVKADAAQRVFRSSGAGQKWAILDSGIDARHMAFRKRDRQGVPEAKDGPPFVIRESKRKGTVVENHTRILKTYDFTLVRDLLSEPEVMLDPEAAKRADPDLSPERIARLETLETRTKEALARDLARGRMLDWEVLEEVIEIPHGEKEYVAPTHKHGTHVAGILGADWRSGDSESDRLSAAPGEEVVRQGICPRIELYDLRVLKQDGTGDEFSINSAMQWVRSINQRTDSSAVHGVNLSLAIPHDMANFACGRTPVCEEVERLVGAGVVVVAAAGNRGKTEHQNKKRIWEDGYQSISITDPGNAEAAITVGATHKHEPHTYGVSYFSSRGPTGDGRRKPDLVAPGEKIWSTTPGQDAEEMDGTSQAAPHVAGAAALLMQRYPELIGRPQKIKRILCESATDLGREPYFQGAGMLDILRALQSF